MYVCEREVNSQIMALPLATYQIHSLLALWALWCLFLQLHGACLHHYVL